MRLRAARGAWVDDVRDVRGEVAVTLWRLMRWHFAWWEWFLIAVLMIVGLVLDGASNKTDA